MQNAIQPALLFLALALSACGGGSTAPAPPAMKGRHTWAP